MGSIDNRANRLDIGVKHPLGLVVRMADIVPRLGFLLTEIAHKSHGHAPSE